MSHDVNASSRELLLRAREGDDAALDALFARYVPFLRRWARGRLPSWARGVTETADVVQDVMAHVFRRVNTVELQRKGALQAYLHRAVQNRIRDEYRRAARRPASATLEDSVPDSAPSPFEQVADLEKRRRFLEALEQLRDTDRELIVAVLDLGYSYEQAALATGKPNAEAARVAVRRALTRLAAQMARV